MTIHEKVPTNGYPLRSRFKHPTEYPLCMSSCTPVFLHKQSMPVCPKVTQHIIVLRKILLPFQKKSQPFDQNKKLCSVKTSKTCFTAVSAAIRFFTGDRLDLVCSRIQDDLTTLTRENQDVNIELEDAMRDKDELKSAVQNHIARISSLEATVASKVQSLGECLRFC